MCTKVVDHNGRIKFKLTTILTLVTSHVVPAKNREFKIEHFLSMVDWIEYEPFGAKKKRLRL